MPIVYLISLAVIIILIDFFNPRYLEGFGLSDGETLERLWSYLRRFAPMTKEMRPSHRIDVLSDALKYYAHKSISGLGS